MQSKIINSKTCRRKHRRIFYGLRIQKDHRRIKKINKWQYIYKMEYYTQGALTNNGYTEKYGWFSKMLLVQNIIESKKKKTS